MYPLLTLACIVITGNHFWIDGIGGIVVFAVGYWIGARIHRWNEARILARYATTAGRREPPQG